MPKFPRNHKDVEYYVAGRKKRITGSTVATNDFLVIIHEENPTLTIRQLRELIGDRTKYLHNSEAEEVLEAYINAGHGDHIPTWK